MDWGRRVILGTAGHIDHGKTTLVRALTGIDTDRLPEEKRRGITIELGFAPLTIEGVGTIGVVDVPGHEAFVRTMVAGATGIDLALVVIAADEGVMPQTREHLAILELLGVRRGVIALTKADLVEDEWLALVEEDVRAATMAALPGAEIIPTSTQTGTGLTELREAIARLAKSVVARPVDDLFRMPIDRAFTIRGTGTVVTGTVWSGRLTADATSRIIPGDQTPRVRGIQGHGVQVPEALPGVRSAVALAGINVPDIPRGAWLVTDKEWRPTSTARADVTLLAGPEFSLRPRTWLRFHVGTAEAGVRVVARDVTPGQPFAARLIFDEPVLLRARDRFVIRTSSPLNTVAGGVITDPHASRRAKLWPVGLSVEGRLEQLVADAGPEGLEIASIPVRLGVTPREAKRVTESAGKFVITASRIFDAARLCELSATALQAVSEYHREHPLDPGMPIQTLRDQPKWHAEAVQQVIDGLIRSDKLINRAGLVAFASWTAEPSPEHASCIAAITSRLDVAGATPPSVGELSTEFGHDVTPELRFLERGGQVIQVEPDRYFTTGHLETLLDRLRAAMSGGAERSPAELKESLDLSRKFLIPLLEYCDRMGYTVRSGTGRVWRSS